MLGVLRERARDQGDAAEYFGHVARLVGRERHAAVLVAEGADDTAAGGELRVGLDPAEKFAGRAADARHGSGGVAFALEEILGRGDRLRDLAEVELREAHGAGEGVRSVADARLEGQLAASAQRAFREATGELRQAQASVLRVRAHDDVLGADAVRLRGADGQV